MKLSTFFLIVLLVVSGLGACAQVTSGGTGPSGKGINVTQPLKIFLPLIVRPGPPLYSTSYYVLTVDSTALYNMGCMVGQIDRDLNTGRDTLVILDFGSPKKVGNEYGTDLFWMGPVGISQITAAVENFGKGYYVCVSSNRSSRIYIGIGTTNYHTSISNTADFYAHGAAWATMVNNVNAWFIGQGYSSQVIATGANDIELAWNTPTVTKAWAAGYDSTNQYDYYNYGALDGCATFTYPNYSLCGNGWTREDAWYITYGTKPVWPIPEIYLTNGVNAQQWELLSLYSYLSKGYPFIFFGLMTQRQACDQATGQCPGLDNTPAQGWNQLYTLMNNDPRTQGSLNWVTDIKWWDGKPPLVGTNSTTYSLPQVGSVNVPLYRGVADQLSAQLAQPYLDDASRQILGEKLQIANRILQDQAAGASRAAPKDLNLLQVAPKSIDVQFESGILDGPGGTFHSWEGDFINHWQDVVNGQYVFISAGSAANDPGQGLVAVMRVQADRLGVTKNVIQAPAGSGKLQVESGSYPIFHLSSASGARYLFDADNNVIQVEP